MSFVSAVRIIEQDTLDLSQTSYVSGSTLYKTQEATHSPLTMRSSGGHIHTYVCTLPAQVQHTYRLIYCTVPTHRYNIQTHILYCTHTQVQHTDSYIVPTQYTDSRTALYPHTATKEQPGHETTQKPVNGIKAILCKHC